MKPEFPYQLEVGPGGGGGNLSAGFFPGPCQGALVSQNTEASSQAKACKLGALVGALSGFWAALRSLSVPICPVGKLHSLGCFQDSGS